jgi:hypothetical protein
MNFDQTVSLLRAIELRLAFAGDALHGNAEVPDDTANGAAVEATPANARHGDAATLPEVAGRARGTRPTRAA